jgi:hypothetical protein
MIEPDAYMTECWAPGRAIATRSYDFGEKPSS